MSAIMVSQVHITNAALFDEYMSKTQRVAARFGAELVTRGRVSSSLAAPGPQRRVDRRTVVVHFEIRVMMLTRKKTTSGKNVHEWVPKWSATPIGSHETRIKYDR